MDAFAEPESRYFGRLDCQIFHEPLNRSFLISPGVSCTVYSDEGMMLHVFALLRVAAVSLRTCLNMLIRVSWEGRVFHDE